MSHFNSVFRNSCLRVPVDPVSKMPKTVYDRRRKLIPQSSVETSSSCSIAATATDLDTDKLKDFYKSIPDYNDIHHLPEDEFYSTLKSLRDKKRLMLGLAIEHIEGDIDQTLHLFTKTEELPSSVPDRAKTKMTSRKYSGDKTSSKNDTIKDSNRCGYSNKAPATCLKQPKKKATQIDDDDKNLKGELKVTSLKSNLEKSRSERPKRNHSACSISWNDAKIDTKADVDQKFDEYFTGKRYPSANDNDDFHTRSMPSSPLRIRRSRSPSRQRGITIPRPFKMTERDEDDRMVHELRSLQKSFSDDMLHLKFQRKKFKAKPVPIESRIPLYDKILEDQAMRRAITKINSEADLRAQMKPFSFTKREEKGTVCDRPHALPKTKKKKRFRARPVPKNLFSNYFYNRVKEDEFFRSMNKRIRAEELLRSSNYPGSMARERSRLSTPAAHSDLPIDPSIPSTCSDRRCASPVKRHKDYITTSPQPFKFNTADRAAKKMEEVTKKIYEDNKSSESIGGSNDGPRARAYTALELRASAAGRSNLAALLRAEAVRRKFEMDSARSLAEQRRKNEIKHRDRLLRSKPAWHLVKNNCEEDIAMRLQTRRDEERMRHEEFMHEMELMYGRVQEQPMLFERYYAPRSFSALDVITMQQSPRKSRKKSKKYYTSPDRSRKVSINEGYTGDVAEYLNSINIDDKISDSEVSLDRGKF